MKTWLVISALVVVITVSACDAGPMRVKSPQQLAEEVRVKYGCSRANEPTTNAYMRTMYACDRVIRAAADIAPLLDRSYAFIDVNGDNLVTQQEITKRFNQIGIKESDEDRDRFGVCDVNNNGELDRIEYNKCSVISYNIMIGKVDFDNDHQLSRTEIILLVKILSQHVYINMTPAVQLEVINNIGKGPGEYFSMHDLVAVDTTLFERFLDGRNL
ncbi:uncharacterized protein LOC100187246 [Ciona intestinalis]